MRSANAKRCEGLARGCSNLGSVEQYGLGVMALRLTVQRAAWQAHIGSIAETVDGLVPVVKGNGYGFGRPTLHPLVKSLSDYVCVGTVYELDSVGDRVTPVVLTPSAAPPPAIAATAILTIGSLRDIDALAGWQGRIIVKLQSSMRRYGATPAELDSVVSAAFLAGLDVVGYSLHLPLAGSDTDRLTEVEAWLELIDDRQPLWLSHLEPQSYADLRLRHTSRQFRLRLGTTLWHGDKSFLHLHTDVSGVHSIRGRRTCRLSPARNCRRRTPRRGRRGLGSRGGRAAGWRQSVPLRCARGWRCSSHRTCIRRCSSVPTATRAPRSVIGSTCNDP